MCLVLLLFGHRGIERRLVGTGIDNREQSTLLDILPLRDRHLRQGAIHARPELHRIICLHRTKAPQPYRHVLLRGGGDRNRDGRSRLGDRRNRGPSDERKAREIKETPREVGHHRYPDTPHNIQLVGAAALWVRP